MKDSVSGKAQADFQHIVKMVDIRIGQHLLIFPIIHRKQRIHLKFKEIDYIFDVEDASLGRMMAFAKRVARAQEAAIPCKRVGLAVMGLEVPHAHIHLIPITKESDMYFGGEKMTISQEELASIAALIRKAYK